MDHALSTHFLVSHRLTTAWLDRIRRAGITAVEIFCAKQHLDYRNRAQIAELAAWFRDSDMTLHSLHAPIFSDDVWGRSGPNSIIDITEPVKARRLVMLDEIKRALDVAESIPTRYLIQHLGAGQDEYSDRRMESAFTSLEELSLYARGRGVEVLLENIPNAFSSVDRLNYFLNETHLNLGYCFDVGHANLKEGVAAAFNGMKERIRSTHIHDNDGKNDGHLYPLLENGTVDWKETMELLRSRPGQYPLLLELREAAANASPLETAQQIFDRLEAL